MKLQLYTIYDTQAQRAVMPFGRDNDDVAKRDFITMCCNPETPFGKHPNDYTLYHCGEWDDKSMLFNPIQPTRIFTGGDAFQQGFERANAQMSLADVVKNAAANGQTIKPQAE